MFFFPAASVVEAHYTRRKNPLQRPELARHSHPITSTDGSIGIRSVDTSTFEDLAAGSRNGSGLGSTGSMLRSGSSSSSIGAATSVLIIVLLVLLLAGGLGNGLGVLLVFVHGPIENIVILESFTDKEITEDLAEVGVIRLIIKAKGPGVVEVDGKLVGEATAENLGGSGHLLLHNTVVLLLLGSSLESLPRKRAPAEV